MKYIIGTIAAVLSILVGLPIVSADTNNETPLNATAEYYSVATAPIVRAVPFNPHPAFDIDILEIQPNKYIYVSVKRYAWDHPTENGSIKHMNSLFEQLIVDMEARSQACASYIQSNENTSALKRIRSDSILNELNFTLGNSLENTMINAMLRPYTDTVYPGSSAGSDFSGYDSCDEFREDVYTTGGVSSRTLFQADLYAGHGARMCELVSFAAACYVKAIKLHDSIPPRIVSITVNTNKGNIVIELYVDKAPTTVSNFLNYIDGGFYNGMIFDRVYSGFMIQGGTYDTRFNKKETRAPIGNEARYCISNRAGTIASARSHNDPNSATAAFFINTVDNNRLDYKSERISKQGYCAFGRVTSGMNVVRQISAVRTGVNPDGKSCSKSKNDSMSSGKICGVPIQQVIINRITRN